MPAASRSAFHAVSEPRPRSAPLRLLRVPFRAMGASCDVVLAATDHASGLRQAAAAVAEVQRIEHRYSRWRDDSIVSRINAAAEGAPVRCDDETWNLLDHADTLHRGSGGLFDVTSGVLRRAWNFRVPDLPTRAELAALVALIGWPRVQRDQRHVRLPEAGMEIDFGAFGKAYAADRAAAAMRAAGADHGYVRLGGDLRAIGPRPDGTPWRVGIHHPRDSRRIVATVPVERGGLATSGDHERYFELGGRRYCHILDPRTGWPVSTWQSVTVQAPTALRAGSCATLAMLQQGRALDALRAAGLNFLAIDQQGSLHTSGTLPFELSPPSPTCTPGS